MGRRSDFPRRPHDDYQTVDPKAVAALLSYIRRDNIRSFAEPCCGDGHLMQALVDLGLRCAYASDIKVYGIDALLVTDFGEPDAIITNPPWTRELLHAMIEHFMVYAPVVWLLFDSDWAYNAGAAPYLNYCTDIVAVGRLKWFNGTAGKDNASWYRFDANHSGGPRFHGRKTMDTTVTDIKPAALVTEFIKLRDEKKQFEEACAAKGTELYGERMAQIEVTLLDLLNRLGVESIAGKGGTAYKKMSVSVTIADAREFRRHIIGNEAWDLADWRANKTVINDLVEAGQEIPPGVNRTTFASIGIRRK
jgi:hypothetical protein